MSASKQQLAAHLQREPQLFSSLLSVLLDMIIFEECANQWSLSRPLLALILTNADYFAEWKASLIAQRHGAEQQERPVYVVLPVGRPRPAVQSCSYSPGPIHSQERLRVAFDKLMHELNGSLEAKNRDKFMQNLTAFRHDIKQLL